jgi:hypothetical protein
MSMNFSEFRRILNSDPASQDPEYQAARRSDPGFIEAAEASDAFELKLSRAFRVSVPDGLADELKALASSQATGGGSLFYRYRYAMAATVVLAVSAMLLTQQLTPRWDSIEGYVAYHYNHDGNQVLQSTANSSPQELGEILATFDLQMAQPLAEQVKFVKLCPTPEGMGVHMVLNTPQGLVTVIIMPDQEIQGAERFAFNDMQASLVGLADHGASAAIIGRAGQLDAVLDQSIQSSIFRRRADA